MYFAKIVQRVTLILINLLISHATSLPFVTENIKNWNSNNDQDCHYPDGFHADDLSNSYLPWSSLITMTGYAKKTWYFMGSIINNYTILTDGKAFFKPTTVFEIQQRDKYKIVLADGQTRNVSYVKIHPQWNRREPEWYKSDHDFILIYLSNPINYQKDKVGPLCIPSTELITEIYNLNTTSAINKLNTTLLIGGNTGSFLRVKSQVTYHTQLHTYQQCSEIWKKSPGTWTPYINRGCGYVVHSNPNITCIKADSGNVLVLNNAYYIIGYVNKYYSDYGRGCDAAALVYTSLLMPDVISWINDDVKCGPHLFSCDNGTRCIDLKYICDGRLSNFSCKDESDQKSKKYCSSLIGCSNNQFKCSTGLAAYCIPKISPTGKVAAYCDGTDDCPNGEDEDPELCVKRNQLSTTIIVAISVLGAIALISTVTAIVVRLKKSQWQQEAIDKEIQAFFENERNLMREEEDRILDTESEADDGDEIPLIEQPTTTTTEDQHESVEIEMVDLGASLPVSIREEPYTPAPVYILGNNVLHIREEIGSGEFGIVRKAFLNDNPTAIAIKHPRRLAPKGVISCLLLELKINWYLHRNANGKEAHPNIARWIGAHYVRRETNCTFFIVFEYYALGSIKKYISENRKMFQDDLELDNTISDEIQQNITRTNTVKNCGSFQQLIKWAAEIAAGMDFLGRNRILQLDLATRNVLVASVNGELVAKIGDFGLSKQMRFNGYDKYKLKTPNRIPWQWLPFEFLNFNTCYLCKTDVWSYGVTIWELFTLCEEPWTTWNFDQNFIKALGQGARLSKPKYATPEMFELMNKCWTLDHTQRPSFRYHQIHFEDFYAKLIANGVDELPNGVS